MIYRVSNIVYKSVKTVLLRWGTRRTLRFMNDLQAQFNNWLDSELKVAGAIAKAFCINIYQEDVEDVYSLDLAGFGYYNEYNEDWACEREEMYSSRNYGKLMVADIAGGRKQCLAAVKELILGYINSGKYAQFFAEASAVDYGFVDGELNIACKAE